MQKYRNLSGDSGVLQFSLMPDGIVVEFQDGQKYYYSNGSAGVSNVSEMKRLAVKGSGLNSFINKYVRKKYERKY